MRAGRLKFKGRAKRPLNVTASKSGEMTKYRGKLRHYRTVLLQNALLAVPHPLGLGKELQVAGPDVFVQILLLRLHFT